MEWISVKDQLPETQQAVLVFTGKSYRVCSLSSEGWSLSGSFHEVDYDDDDWDYDLTFIANVTHWMPLPEPPNEDSSNMKRPKQIPDDHIFCGCPECGECNCVWCKSHECVECLCEWCKNTDV